jgi:hypothetical protein
VSDIPDVQLKRIARVLRRSGGNMRQAAIKLKMARPELAALLRAKPLLLEAALEAEERALDLAEANLRQALRSENQRERLAAASHIVRRSPRWRKLRQTGE